MHEDKFPRASVDVQACLSDFEKFKQKMADRENAMQRAANQQIADATAKYQALAERVASVSGDIDALRSEARQAQEVASSELSKVQPAQALSNSFAKHGILIHGLVLFAH